MRQIATQPNCLGLRNAERLLHIVNLETVSSDLALKTPSRKNWTMLRICFPLLVFVLALLSCVEAETFPGQGMDAGKTVLYRDTWGVAHIYAPSPEDGVYAMGWAQAQDRPEALLKNFLRGMGEISSVEGPAGLQTDLVAKLWNNYEVSREQMGGLSQRSRQMVQAFVRGINDFYSTHPEDVPEWWGSREVDEAMVHAFGRLFLNSWSIDDGFGDLRRGGVEPTVGREQRGSNQWAVAPGRSALGAAILLIDPHLSWWGASRFWEFRIHAGDLRGSGVTLTGFPVIGLGHNENLAWAMTTGGPDTADIYRLKIRPGNPPSYLFDGRWRRLQERTIQIDVLGVGPQEIKVYNSHHGPVVAVQGDQAYAHRTAYAEEVRNMDAWYTLCFGEDYTAAQDALAMQALFPQNVMVADTAGNIYYQRTGRVPVRPEGFDWTRPVDGSTSQTEWQGFHPSTELVQILNPPQGYMQNCNISPDTMMVDSPMTADRFPPYIFSDRGSEDQGGWSNQRGSRAVELLAADSSVTIEEALEYAVDVHPFGSERWIALLKTAHDRFGSAYSDQPDYSEGISDLLRWDQKLTRDSTGALKYYYWRRELVEESQTATIRRIRQQTDNLLAPIGKVQPLPELGNARQKVLLEAFVNGIGRLKANHGDINTAYGDAFRVGRDADSWPLGGGGEYGTQTLRDVSYGPPRPDKTRWGRGGQTSTQIVVLTKPIQSWSVLPIGQSDRQESPHFDDQAEKLFSTRNLKPTWWRPEELKPHIVSRAVIEVTGPDE